MAAPLPVLFDSEAPSRGLEVARRPNRYTFMLRTVVQRRVGCIDALRERGRILLQMNVVRRAVHWLGLGRYPQRLLEATRGLTIASAATLALASCWPMPEAASAPPPRAVGSAVRGVQVSDIRDAAFFVSWVSEQPEVGAIKWGAAGTNPTNCVADSRGDVASQVHLVRVTNLNSSTAYGFDVISGTTVDNQSGQHFRVTTGPTLPISNSDSIYGRVLTSAGVASRDVLVTITVRGTDGSSAAPMVTLIGPKDDGYWTSNLGNARTANSAAWFTISPATQVEVVADGGALGRATATLDLSGARAGTSVLRLDGAATLPSLPAGSPSAPICTQTLASPTAGASSGAPAAPAPASGGAPAPAPGAARPIVVAPAPAVAPLPKLPDGSTLQWNAALDAASPGPGFPAAPTVAPALQAPTLTVAPTALVIPSRGLITLDQSAPTAVQIVGVGTTTVSINDATQQAFERMGATTVAIAYDAAPPIENEVQAGSLGGGVVVPAGRPIDIRLDLRTAAGASVVPDGPEGATVSITLPVLAAPPGVDGTFTWLVATYDADGFAGYERAPAVFDPSTNRTTLSLAPNQLRGTLFLPTVIVPAMVTTIEPDARIWSTPWDDASDFGPVGPALTDLVVVAPQVRGRLYVYNPITANYGWIGAERTAPV